MDRKKKYLELLAEIANPPVGLEYVMERAEARLKSQQKYRLFTGLVSGVVSLAIAFVLLVNFSMGFAHACGKVPLIKELARLVAFSPSLTAALENDYVQLVGLEQSDNDITARVEYVIVDQKQLEIFYSLNSTRYFHMDVTPEIRAANGEQLEGCSIAISSGSFNEANGELRRLTVDFVEGNMPNRLQLILKVHDNEAFDEEAVSPEEFLLTRGEYASPDYISRFAFLLEFDPYYTAQGKTIAVNKTFRLADQTLTLATLDIYPTHLRLNLKDHRGNTAWLKSLEFYLEDERGERYRPIANGITATGSTDSPMLTSHRVESPYFSESKNLVLYITGATWLDKEMARVRVDLKNAIAEALPPGVELAAVERKEEGWLLTFSAEQLRESFYHQLWDWTYYDEEGNEYRIDGVASTTGLSYDGERGEPVKKPERFTVTFALKDYPYDQVYLVPAYSRVVKFSPPVAIRIK